MNDQANNAAAGSDEPHEAADPNEHAYSRFVRERFAAFRGAYNALLEAIDIDTSKATRSLNQLDTLAAAMATVDQPEWMGVLRRALTRYKSQPAAKHATTGLLRAILQTHADIESQTWDHLRISDARAFDFEALYEQYYNESRIPEFCDKLLGLLGYIVTSGAVDSAPVIRRLEDFIATVQRNKDAGPNSARGIVHFGRILMEELTWEALSEIPVAGAAFRAVRSTIDKIDAENQLIEQRSEAAIADQTAALPATPKQLPPGLIDDTIQ